MISSIWASGVKNTFKIPNLQYQAINLLFLPKEINDIKNCLEDLGELLNSFTILANIKDYDNYLETSSLISKCLNIKNPSTTFLSILELSKQNINNLKKIAFDNENIDYTPISTILGRSDINKEYAITIDNALNKMVDKRIIKKNEKGKGLYLLAQEYLKNIKS